jgi:hypothetical protein
MYLSKAECSLQCKYIIWPRRYILNDIQDKTNNSSVHKFDKTCGVPNFYSTNMKFQQSHFLFMFLKIQERNLKDISQDK